MEAGRELDALVAEKVMGCDLGKRVVDLGGPDVWIRERGGEPYKGPRETRTVFFCQCSPVHAHNEDDGEILDYSTDIAAAWEVLEACPGIMSYRSINRSYDGSWEIENRDGHGCSEGTFVKGKTFPQAICLAALKLVPFRAKVKGG